MRFPITENESLSRGVNVANHAVTGRTQSGDDFRFKQHASRAAAVRAIQIGLANPGIWSPLTKQESSDFGVLTPKSNSKMSVVDNQFNG